MGATYRAPASMSSPEYWILQGSNIDAMARMPDCSIDAIVTDPPYGLGTPPDALTMLSDWLSSGHHDKKGSGFMGRDWDCFVPQPAFWREAFRVLKTGGHVLAFSGARTNDLATLAMRLAGFEIRDCLMWLYGSGFPKSLDIGKALDKAAGAEREALDARPKIGLNKTRVNLGYRPNEVAQSYNTGAAVSAAAKQWDGYGTALKPAYEPITLARKPIAGSIAANVLAHGVGGLNIAACRIGSDPVTINRFTDGAMPFGGAAGMEFESVDRVGRWPANVLHDGSPEIETEFAKYGGGNKGVYRGGGGASSGTYPDDAGTPSRFFYSAKCSTFDRDEGLIELEMKTLNRVNAGGLEHDPKFAPVSRRNNHPTVKPTELMRYLVRLIVPTGGVCLDPFAGSGSTGKASMLEGVDFIGCELDAGFAEIAAARCSYAQRIRANAGTQGDLFI